MTTFKNLLRLSALLCMIFVFTPSFLVSCSGQEMGVSALTAIEGVSVYGETIVEPHWWILVCLLIPLAILAILFTKKYSEKFVSKIILSGILVDLIIWILFRNVVRSMASEILFTYRVTVWYVLNMITMLTMILISSLVLLNRITIDSDVLIAFKNIEGQKIMGQISDTLAHMSKSISGMAESSINNQKLKDENNQNPIVGECEKCQAPILSDYKFCVSCGQVVPEKPVVLEEEPICYCKNCGEKIETSANFCSKCGSPKSQ